MNYRKRIILALMLSLVLNALLVTLPWPSVDSMAERVSAPLVFTLPPPEPEAPEPERIPQVVETIPGDSPPEPEAALLSDADSVARGESGPEEQAVSPMLDLLDEAFNLPRPAAAPENEAAPQAPVTPELPAGETRAEESPAPEAPAPEEPAPEAPAPAAPAPEEPAPEAPVRIARAEPLPAEAPRERAQDSLSRPVSPPAEASAPAARAAPAPPQMPEPGRSAMHGVTVEGGYASFSALRDDVAAYVLYLKPLIRQEWVTLLLTRYSGVSPTEAMVRVGISPAGDITLLEIVDTPRDRIFATLCREAIRKAGPFKPFPFRVPPEFQKEDLIIRWNFRFL